MIDFMIFSVARRYADLFPAPKYSTSSSSAQPSRREGRWACRCHGYAGLASATLRAETPRMTREGSVDVAAAPGTLHVALLGGFSVQVGGRAVPSSWRLRKSKTLVKLLALADGHRAHRDVLAGVLWPGRDPAAAANNLHQALHAARRALASDRSPSADALCLRDDIVILWPDGDLIVDADVFAAAAQRALRSGSVEDYGVALKLYAGELLPEDRYADWAAPHRERLAALHEALAAGLARALLERRSPEEAVALLEPLVADRPHDEPLHRVLMEALDRAGRRWDALDVYERLCRVLEEEYAAAPEAATRSLYRRILSGQSSAGPAVVCNLPAAVTSFIGRRREIAEARPHRPHPAADLERARWRRQDPAGDRGRAPAGERRHGPRRSVARRPVGGPGRAADTGGCRGISRPDADRRPAHHGGRCGAACRPENGSAARQLRASARGLCRIRHGAG